MIWPGETKDVSPWRISLTEGWPAKPSTTTEPLSATLPPSNAQGRLLSQSAIWRRRTSGLTMAVCVGADAGGVSGDGGCCEKVVG